MGHTGNDYPAPSGFCRFVIVMSHPVQQTIDLPKPASGDILYLQTEARDGRYSLHRRHGHEDCAAYVLHAGSHLNIPSTRYSVDIGLGHPTEIPFLNAAFSWLPDEFQAPLPSLPNPSSASPASSLVL